MRRALGPGPSPLLLLAVLAALSSCPEPQTEPDPDPEPEPPTESPEPYCGDGSIDTDEDCDDAGPSALCDEDCSFAECGDGLLNELYWRGLRRRIRDRRLRLGLQQR